MNQQDLARYRNDIISYVKIYPVKRNVINLNTHNSWLHESIKCRVCYELQKQGKHYVTEARMNSTKRNCIADILILDTAEVIEILVSETQEEVKEKVIKYPKGLDILSVTDAEQYFNGNYKVVREKEV